MADDDQLELSVTRHDRRSESRRVMQQLRRDADRIALRFELRYKAILAERNGVNEHYGVCYANGEIRIRLRHAKTGRVLKYSSLIDTLCHELAHLKHFDHSERFYEFFEKLLQWAREQDIYQPGPATAAEEARKQAVRSAPPALGAGPSAEPRGVPAELQLPLFGNPALRDLLRRG